MIKKYSNKLIDFNLIKKYKIGLIVGDGTGAELSNVFNLIMDFVSKRFNVNIEIVKCPCVPRTYNSFHNKNFHFIKENIQKDIKCLWDFFINFYSNGGRVIFRTAINAETLYQIRLLGKAVKIMPLINSKYKTKILIIRDLAEGFYVNKNYEFKKGMINFSGNFTQKRIKELCNFSLRLGEIYFDNNFEFWCIYKYHLFANVLENWFNKYISKYHIYQPDTGIHNIVHYINNNKNEKNLIILTGNEIGDSLIEFLILYLNIGTKEQLYNKDIFLLKDLKNLEVYQTVHGSADNIAGKNIVNPIATIRAVGAIIEEKLGLINFQLKIENAIKKAIKKGITTPDMGGKNTTIEVTNFIISEMLK